MDNENKSITTVDTITTPDMKRADVQKEPPALVKKIEK